MRKDSYSVGKTTRGRGFSFHFRCPDNIMELLRLLSVVHGCSNGDVVDKSLDGFEHDADALFAVVDSYVAKSGTISCDRSLSTVVIDNRFVDCLTYVGSMLFEKYKRFGTKISDIDTTLLICILLNHHKSLIGDPRLHRLERWFKSQDVLGVDVCK